MMRSIVSCQSAQPVASGVFNSSLPEELPAFRETSS